MKRIVSLLLASLLLLGSALADSIAVSGTATVTAQPDIAIVRLGAEVLRDEVSDAQRDMNGIINAVLAALEGDEAFGLAEADIQTENYYIGARYHYDYDSGEQIQDGYRASCTLAVRVNDLDMAGAIIDAAFAAGANSLDGVDFALSDSTDVNDQALTLALQDAMRKAQLVAQVTGVALDGMTMNVRTDNVYSYSTTNFMYDAYTKAEEAGTALRGGALSFTADVTVTYESK